MNDRATRIEEVRRANLGEVLRLVHHRGPRSRAVITAETGLNRSTVSALVSDLVGAGLVEEREPDVTRKVGRPSPIVVASDDVVAIAVNPEIDAIEVGAVTLGGTVRERARIATPRAAGVAEVVQTVVDIVSGWRDDALAGCRMVGIGVAVPGLVRASDGLVRLAPHLGWEDEDIAAPLAEATGLPVVVGNDATLGARAERIFGSARDHADVVYLNGGASGIGGGAIVQGIPLAGADGYAGEWGQTSPSMLRPDDRLVPDGVLEDEVNRARLFAAAGLDEGDDAALAAALVDAAPEAAAEIERQRRVLAATLSNAIDVLNPSMIVLGGFLAVLLDHDADGFAAAVRARALAAPAERLRIRSAALGADRLLIGAAEAAFAALLADPLC